MNVQAYEDRTFGEYSRTIEAQEAIEEAMPDVIEEILNDPNRLASALDRDPRWVNNVAHILIHWIATGDPAAHAAARAELADALTDDEYIEDEVKARIWGR
jgi:hypothetical protein